MVLIEASESVVKVDWSCKRGVEGKSSVADSAVKAVGVVDVDFFGSGS